MGRLDFYAGKFNIDFLQPAEYSTCALFSSTLNSQKVLQYLSHRMFAARTWSIKRRRKKKIIAQFGGKLRDERFEPN